MRRPIRYSAKCLVIQMCMDSVQYRELKAQSKANNVIKIGIRQEREVRRQPQ